MCLIPVQFSKISASLLPKSAVLIYQVSILVSITFINFLRKILEKFVSSIIFESSSFDFIVGEGSLF